MLHRSEHAATEAERETLRLYKMDMWFGGGYVVFGTLYFIFEVWCAVTVSPWYLLLVGIAILFVWYGTFVLVRARRNLSARLARIHNSRN